MSMETSAPPATERVTAQSAPPERTARISRSALAAIALTTVALLPIIVTVIARAGRHYFPVQDFALVDLRVRDVFSREIPLAGPYSRYGWNHPGPAMFWIIAPLSGIFGRAAWATQVGGALIQAIAIVAAARLAWKLGRLPLVTAVLAVFMLAYGVMGSWIVLQPWNPHAAYPFLMLFVLQCWAISLGGTRQVIGAALVATFLVQTHAGYLPLAVAGALFAAAVVVLDIRRRHAPADVWRRPLRIAGIVTAIAWLPVVLEQLIHGRDGNIVRLARYFLKKNSAVIGFHWGAGVVAEEFKIPPPWLGGHHHYNRISTVAVPASLKWYGVPIVLIGAGWLAARHRGARGVQRLIELSTVVLIVAVFATSRVTGPAVPYLFYWRTPVAVIVAFAALAGLATLVPVAWRRIALPVTCVVLAGVVCVNATNLAVKVARDKGDGFAPYAQRVLRQIEAGGRPQGPILVRAASSSLLGLEGGLFDELDRQGVPVRVDKSLGFQYGYGRVIDPRRAHQVWYVVETSQFLSLLAALPGARVIAEITPLSPAEEQELRSLQLRVAQQLTAAHRPDLIDDMQSSLFGFLTVHVAGVDQHAANRVAALNREVELHAPCRCGVVAFPPTLAPGPGFSKWKSRSPQLQLPPS